MSRSSSPVSDESPPRETNLSRLIQTRRAALDLSYRDLAERSGLSLSGVHKIATGRNASLPTAESTAAMAQALQLPQQALMDAIAADLGIHEYVVEEGERQAIYLATEKLTAAERATVLTVINAILQASARRRR